jgi:hypothetical protein
MKEELRSAVAGGYGGTRVNRRQKYRGAGKSGKIHFSAKIIFLPSFRWAGLPR